MRRLLGTVLCLAAATVLLALGAGTVVATPGAVEARPVALQAAGDAALAPFRAALARIDAPGSREVARIAVFGDSHIACDLFTGALRRRLQERHGDAGRGFVLLGTAWPLYRPLDVVRGSSPAFPTRRLRPRDTVPVRFGLGSAVSTSLGPGALTWVGTSDARTAARMELFYDKAPGAGRLRVKVDGREQAIVDTQAASPRAGYHVVDARDGAHRLEVEALGPGPVTVFGAVLERQGPGVVVDSLGVPALASANMLQSDEALLREHLARRDPDLVISAFGTNDLRWERLDLPNYRRDVAAFLRRLRRGAPEAACLVLGPIDRVHKPTDGEWVASLEQIVREQKGAAADAGCAFWDQRAAMGGEGSMARWMEPRPRLTLRDGVHLAARGYDLLAGALVRVIDE